MSLAADPSAASSAGSTVAAVFILIAAAGLYWLPTIIAAIRRLPHIGPTAVMNVFAFVIVPWWLALMMAVRTQPRPQYVVPGGWGPQPPLPPATPAGPPLQPQPWDATRPQAPAQDWYRP